MKNRNRFLLFFILQPLAFSLSSASWDAPIALTSSGDSSLYYGVAADSTKFVHVVRGDSVNRVGYFRSQDSGVTWDAEIKIAGTGRPYLDRPIVVEGSHVYVIFIAQTSTIVDWCCAREIGDIYFVHSSNNGDTWSSPSKITSTANAYRISVTASGNYVYADWMAYKDGGGGGSTWDIVYRSSSDNGTTWGTEVQLVAGSVVAGKAMFGAERPTIQARNAEVYAAWTDARDWPTNGCYAAPQCSEIYFKKSTDRGATWGSDTRLTSDLDPNSNPVNGPLRSGRPDFSVVQPATILLSYEHTLIYQNGNVVVLQRSIDDGTTWTKTQLSTVPSGHGSMAAQGDIAHIAWWDRRSGIWNIWYRVSKDGGATWQPEEQVTNDNSDENIPMVAAGAGFYGHIVWLDSASKLWYRRRLATPGNYYVDPDWPGTQIGTAAQPWATMTDVHWTEISTALANDNVTLYLSPLKANGSTQQSQAWYLHLERSDGSANRLTVDGYSLYNSSITSPKWLVNPHANIATAYTSGKVFKLTGDGSDALGMQRGGGSFNSFVTNSLGVAYCCIRTHVASASAQPGFGASWTNYWDQHGSASTAWASGTTYVTWSKQDNVTIRGFEVTGSGARTSANGDNLVMQYLNIHDITGIGPGLDFTYSSFPDNTGSLTVSAPSSNAFFHDIQINKSFGEAFYVGAINPNSTTNFQYLGGNRLNGITISNMVISGAGFYGAQGDGIDFKDGVLNFKIVDCDINNFDGNGVNLPLNVFNATQNNLIERTKIHDGVQSGQGGQLCVKGTTDAPTQASLYGIVGLTIRNCLIYNSNQGIQLTGSTGHPVTDAYVYNNTFYHITNTALVVSTLITNIFVTNNFVFNVVGDSVNANLAAVVNSDYNAHDGTWLHTGEGSHTITLTKTDALASVASTNSPIDLHLVQGSALIGAGFTVPSFANDFEQTSRPKGSAWEIGAYEFQQADAILVQLIGRRYMMGRFIR